MKEVKFLTLDQQYEYLKSKGLLFKNTKQSKLLLSSIGYYRLINGYKTIFTTIEDNVKTFDKDVYFENIHALYKFDIELKALIFQYALSIEIQIKSLLSNLLSQKYGVEEDIYLNKNNFKNNEEEYNNFKNHFKSDFNEFKQKLKSLYKKLNTSIGDKYYTKVITLMGVVDGWDKL